jgi:DNA repair exonuclease SbcCD ATPase subunit
MWGKVEKEAENFWKWVQMVSELDLKKKAEGCELDELNAHVFLEKNNETMTVKQLRDKLREIGWEKRPMMFPTVVYLIMKFKADWHYIVNAPQGDNQKEIEKAQKMLEEVEKLLQQAIQAAEDAKVAAEAAAARQAEAAEAKIEMERAVAEVKAQEDARDNKTKDLQKKSEEGGAVSRNKAKAELAAHLSEDPLPLRKAKITLEAADRKAAKTLKAATEAREKADAAAIAAEKAVEETQAKLREAEAYLEEVKQAGGDAMGALWWMSRELEEKKKYLPSSKGGVTRK